MNMNDLEDLIRSGESETLEFKRSTGQLGEAMKALCAFLNGRGGTVVFGVSPDGKPVGQDVGKETMNDIAMAVRRIEPNPKVATERVSIRDSSREVILIRAEPEEGKRPYAYEGRAYERLETMKTPMGRDRYQELLIESSSEHRWERQLSEGYDLADLDPEEIARTVRLGIEKGRLPESTSSDPRDFVKRTSLRLNGDLTNAAVVLFAREMNMDYPQCEIRMARFKGTDKSKFIDNRKIQGNIFVLLEEARVFLDRHVSLAGHIEPGRFERVDRREYHFDAVREALVNAFCHRDYSNEGGAVFLAVYNDRLEVWSIGKLPVGITIDELKVDHDSVLRNPTISNVLYKRGLVEQWGTGTKDMVSLCVKNGYPEPVFKERTGSVGVIFPRSKKAGAGETSDGAQVKAQVKAQVTDSQLMQDILRSCTSPKRSSELVPELGHKKRSSALTTALKYLLDEGLIEYTIPEKPRSRNQRYVITKRGEKVLNGINRSGSDDDR